MIIHNERTKESDNWQDIEVPVTPYLYLYSDAFLGGPDLKVFLIKLKFYVGKFVE